MFTNESFLRRLPVALDLEQRLAIGALVYSADALEHSFQRMRAIAGKLGRRIGTNDEFERRGLFLHAWSMVDQIHVIRQLIKSLAGDAFSSADSADPLKSYAKELVDFYRKYESATILRNKMDHLAQNIPNLAKSKGPSPPIFGVLSYSLVEHHNCRIVDGRRVIDSAAIVTVNSGALTHAHSMPVLNPGGRTLDIPVSHFQLSAFDQVISLHEAAIEVRPILSAMENEIERSCKESAQALARESGESIEKLMGNTAGGLTIVLSIKFEPQDVACETSIAMPSKWTIPKQP